MFVLIFRICKPNSVNLGDSLRRFWIGALFEKNIFEKIRKMNNFFGWNSYKF